MQQYVCPICSAIGAGSIDFKYLCHICTDNVYMIKSSNGRMIFDAGIWSGDNEYIMLNPFTCNDFDWIIEKDVFFKYSLRKVKGIEKFMHAEPWKKGEHIVVHLYDK